MFIGATGYVARFSITRAVGHIPRPPISSAATREGSEDQAPADVGVMRIRSPSGTRRSGSVGQRRIVGRAAVGHRAIPHSKVGALQRPSLVLSVEVVVIALASAVERWRAALGGVGTSRHARALGVREGSFEELYNIALEPSRPPSRAMMSPRRAAQRER